MAVFDLTLSSFKFANTDGFTRDFGTKKTREQNGGSLTSRECNENSAKIFDTQRPFIVSENSSTGNIEYNATFVIGDNLSLTVGSATFTGCEIRLISGKNSSVITNSKTQILPDKSCNTLFWDGNAWNLSTNTSVPVGFVYTQFPLMPTPDKIFVGDWEDVSHLYAGLFLRVAGEEATAFENIQEVVTQSDTTLTFNDNHGITTQCILIDTATGERRAVTAVTNNTVTIASAFSTNLSTVLIGQLDQFQGHEHRMYDVSASWDNRNGRRSGDSWIYNPTTKDTGDIINKSNYGTPRYGDETRSKNISVKIWQRIS